jgi:hypothetical protein
MKYYLILREEYKPRASEAAKYKKFRFVQVTYYCYSGHFKARIYTCDTKGENATELMENFLYEQRDGS